MDSIQRSSAVHREADLVLEKIALDDILRPCGGFTPTGSYFLDTMIYPDIDVYISRQSIEEMFRIGARLAACELVFQVRFEKSRDASLPDGLYISPRILYGNWGRPWKVDIWSLDDPVISDKMVEMQRFKDKLTPQLREQILRYKASILTPEGRTPVFSGYFIYKAFLDEGMSDFRDVTRYLKANGIAVS